MYRATIGNQTQQAAAAVNGLAAAAVWADDKVSAERNNREAVANLQTTVSRNHPDNAVALGTLGYILTQRAKYAEAEQALNEALQIESSVFGTDSQRMAATQADLAILYDRQGDTPRAIVATQAALKITRDKCFPGHYLNGYYLDVAWAISI